MRRGPNYPMYVDRDEKGAVTLQLPLELEMNWEECDVVMWTDNGDGTYTLRPYGFLQ